MATALQAPPAPKEAAQRANPVVATSVSPELAECLAEDCRAQDRKPAYIMRTILENHYAARLAEKKSPKLAGIEA